jgi:hypothetical protein
MTPPRSQGEMAPARIAIELRLHKAQEALLDYANWRKAGRQAHMGVAVTTYIYEAITDAIAALADPPVSPAETPRAETCATCRHSVVWWSNRNYLACQHPRCPVQVLTHDRAAEWGCSLHEPQASRAVEGDETP